MSSRVDEIVISDDDADDVRNLAEFEVVNLPSDNKAADKHFTCDLCHLSYKDESHFMLHWKIDHENNKINSVGDMGMTVGHSSTDPIEIDSSDDECINGNHPRVQDNNSLLNKDKDQSEQLESWTLTNTATVPLAPPDMSIQCAYEPVSIQSDGCTFSVAPIMPVPDSQMNQEWSFTGRVKPSQQVNILPYTHNSYEGSIPKCKTPDLPQAIQHTSVAVVEPNKFSPTTESFIGPETNFHKVGAPPCDSRGGKEQDSLVSSTTMQVQGLDQTCVKPQPLKKTRKLTSLSNRQIKQLSTSFQKQHYPTKAEMEDLASSLDIEFPQVKLWFQNQRVKRRKSGGQKTPTPRNKKRLEKLYSNKQHETLTKTFERTQYLTELERRKLEASTGLTVKQINQWFARKRIMHKKLSAKPQRKPPSGYSADQLQKLHAAFDMNKRPTLKERTDLAVSTGLTVVQVSGWLNYQRKKHDMPTKETKRNRLETSDKEVKAKVKEGKVTKEQPVKCGKRSFLSIEQTDRLRIVFQKTPWPSKTEMNDIASLVHITPAQVNRWFVNQRNYLKIKSRKK